MEKSFEVTNSLSRLQAMADVRPELAPVVGVAMDVVKSAREGEAAAVDRALRAEERARLAEETLAGVKPHVDELAERAESAERDVAARSAIDAAREMEAERAERRSKDWALTPRALRMAGEVAEQVEALRAGQEAQKAGIAKAVQLLTVIHRSVKNQDGKSPLQSFKEGGEWTITDADGAVIATIDRRSEAIALVQELLEEETAEIEAEKSAAEELTEDERYRPEVRDQVHPATPWRDRRKNPEPVEQPPGTAPIATGESKRKRKRKQARIL